MKTALITGASRGIGKALAIKFAREGYEVICVSRDDEALSETVKRIHSEGFKAVACRADLANPDNIDDLTNFVNSNFDKLDYLAVLASPETDPDEEEEIETTSVSQISAYVDVVLKAGILLTKSMKEKLLQGESASILFIASDWALRGYHGPATFAAVKAGIAHFARGIRKEFAKGNIRVTTVFPGDIATYDEAWENPKWDLDSPLGEVKKELGNSRIPLSEFINLMFSVSEFENCIVEELIVSPIDGDYDY